MSEEFIKPNYYVDVYDLSHLRQTIEGKVRLSDMKRLDDVLTNNEGSISFKIRGIVGDQGWPGAVMELNGVLSLECNRCFKPMEFPLEREVVFRFAKDEAEADSIPIEEDDDTEVIVGSRKLGVLDWIEEEVLLSIPLVPLHDEMCVETDGYSTDDEEDEKPENPFAKLKDLKGLRSH